MAAGHNAPRRSKSRVARSVQTVFQQLEARLLFHAIPGTTDYGSDDGYGDLPTVAVDHTTTTSGGGTGTTLSASPLSSVPQLNSDPGAPAELYLDFVGDPNNHNTPAYTTDADPTTFSSQELDNIRQIWARVSEAYSPFNLNVTTVDPGNLNAGHVMRVLIGGNGAWSGMTAGGLGYVGGFNYTGYNTAWVFSVNEANGDPRYTADAAIHESGHGFGLNHQSVYSGTTKTAEYYGGTSAKAPNMGVSYYSTRNLWWHGQSSVAYNDIQDDMTVISGSANGFGYRPEDAGQSVSTATPLTLLGNDVTPVNGIITTTGDTDFYSFTSAAGQISFHLNYAQYGETLDAKLVLTDASGNVIATADDTAGLGAAPSLTATVGGGSYRIEVTSHGGYGDVGQYALSGTVIGDPDFVAAPSGVHSTAVSASSVSLAWTDNSTNATGFKIQRSTDGGTTWSDLDTATGTSYTDSTVNAGTTYAYRVMAVGPVENSAYSAAASVVTIPAAPTGLSATTVNNVQVNLAWTDTTGETGFRVERSTDGGTTWAQVGTTGAGVTSYQDKGCLGGNTYSYRVRAADASGVSDASDPASATTTNVKPVVPASLAAVVTLGSRVNLSWTDTANDEFGFKVQRSTDGGTTWIDLTTTSAAARSYQDGATTPGTTYSYRVLAIGSGTTSDPSNTATAVTAPRIPGGVALSNTSGNGQVNVVLNWNDVAGEIGYKIFRSTSATTGWAVVGTVGAGVTTYTDANLAQGVTYFYRVDAYNASGDASTAAASIRTIVLPPAAPNAPVANSPTPFTVGLTWAPVARATGYRVERSADGGTTWAQVGPATIGAPAYFDVGLAPTTAYAYRVRAVNAGGASDAGAATTVTTQTLYAPMTPTGLTLRVQPNGKVHLFWAESYPYVDGYTIQRSTDGGTTWAPLATINNGGARDYVDLTTPAGTSLKYRVAAFNRTAASGSSAAVAVTTACAPPTGLAAANFSDGGAVGVDFSWNGVVGATGYRIDRSTNPFSGWAAVGTTTPDTTTFHDTGLVQNVSYFYRVHALNAGGDALSGAVGTRTVLLPAAVPTGLAATAISPFAIKLTWTAVPYAAGYKVERSDDGGTTWAQVAQLGIINSYVSGGLASATDHSYRIRAFNAAGTSDYASPVTATTQTLVAPATPTGLLAKVQPNGRAHLYWAESYPYVDGFTIQKSTDGGNTWTTVGNTPNGFSRDYVDVTTAAGSTDQYRVFGFNAAGNSDNSAVAIVTVAPALPAGGLVLADTNTDAQVGVAAHWNDTTGETGYRIERSTNPFNGWVTIGGTLAADTTSYADANLLQGFTYWYRLHAFNAGGDVVTSPVGIKTTILPAQAPSNLTATAVAKTQVNLAWTVGANAWAYKVQRSADGGSTWTQIAVVGMNVLSIQDKTVVAGHAYAYRVSATNPTGDSAFSATATATTPSGSVAPRGAFSALPIAGPRIDWMLGMTD